MRPAAVLAAVTLVLALAAPQASAAPGASSALPLALPVALEHETVGLGFGTPQPQRPFGYRIQGGYYTTEYRWVYVPGRVRYTDAFGRSRALPGRYEQRPYTVWVPHTVRYARPHSRDDYRGPRGPGGGAPGGAAEGLPSPASEGSSKRRNLDRSVYI